jgi:hypothetical protein
MVTVRECRSDVAEIHARLPRTTAALSRWDQMKQRLV